MDASVFLRYEILRTTAQNGLRLNARDCCCD